MVIFMFLGWDHGRFTTCKLQQRQLFRQDMMHRFALLPAATTCLCLELAGRRFTCPIMKQGLFLSFFPLKPSTENRYRDALSFELLVGGRS
jgi:hypothetical protein